MPVFKSDEEIVNHVKASLANAYERKSKLGDRMLISSGILTFYGMSGQKTRHLINNLASFPGLKYAEVGSYMGSTLLSALYGNDIEAVICDNWSEFGGPKDLFFSNVGCFVNLTQKKNGLFVYDHDFYTLELDKNWKDVDFYIFDGPHEERHQYDGIVKAFDALSDRFILIVDDWFWQPPRDGTFRALKDLDVEILYSTEIQVENEKYDQNRYITNRFEASDWHNGIGVFACKKKQRS